MIRLQSLQSSRQRPSGSGRLLSAKIALEPDPSQGLLQPGHSAKGLLVVDSNDRIGIVPLPTFVLPVRLDTVLALATFLFALKTESKWVDGPFPADRGITEGILFAFAEERQRGRSKRRFFLDLAPRRRQGVRIAEVNTPGDGS